MRLVTPTAGGIGAVTIDLSAVVYLATRCRVGVIGCVMNEPTRTDAAGVTEWKLDDIVVQLREWGTRQVYELPTAATGEWLIGTERTCDVRLVDRKRLTSRLHARLSRDRTTWTLTDAGSKNGLWLDDARRPSFVLAPGVEVGIGGLRLIAESRRMIEVRAFLSRILGWGEERQNQIDRALRSLREMATRRSPLVLLGEGDLVAVARSVHRKVLGEKRPFIVSDPRRVSARVSSRSPQNHADVRVALQAAEGGTLCVWASRLPRDFDEVRAQLERPGEHVRVVMCAYTMDEIQERIPVGAAITLTPLSQRAEELDRIIDEYAAEAIADLGAKTSSFTAEDRAWTRRRRAKTLEEIETTVTRLVAIREWGGVTRAAPHLGITHVALLRWFDRRSRH
jgi:hypothetical protein